MNFESSILLSTFSLGVTEKYYGLCDRFPYRAGALYAKIAAKELLNAAQGKIQISKLPGPGAVFQLVGLPDDVSLNFIVQSGGTVETDFSLLIDGQKARGTFAILCNESVKNQGFPAPNPAYPRPIGSSAEEMVSIFQSLGELVLVLAKGAVKVD
ncbi:hypothetical protein [Herbaspirillum sp. CF444]|uniref:hypothetical protein n=1 Tax=Herbaspirillum sp. CF444 TaxID=1144319 RepID=UPI0012FB7790|nr:hypothetical protein [Herbaspirillum sp. CF444]